MKSAVSQLPLEGSVSQRTIVITGASDGIGAATARRLAARGERLLLHGRSATKLAAVAEPLGAESFVADFERLSDVRDLGQQLLERVHRIDVLANNAGGIFGKRKVTVDGNERTMQVNYYAHFLLTHLLFEVLRESRAKIVSTSSIGAWAFGRIDLTDLDNKRKYRATKAYGDSKLANILFTKALHAHYHGEGISAVALHPGNIASNFGNDGATWLRFIYRSPLRHLLSTPNTGAKNLLWAIDGTPDVTWRSGEYYESRRIPRRVNHQQNDAALVVAFWKESARRVGIDA